MAALLKASRHRYFECLRLNWYIFRLAFARKWLSESDVAGSYNEVAEYYDEIWLQQLRKVTDKFLSDLPEPGNGSILDLGCGTGYTTRFINSVYPSHNVRAVDISDQMIRKARSAQSSSKVDFHREDMLTFLEKQKSGSASMILSAWAIGYSKPAQIIHEAARVLREKGIFAFVVNYADTLAPVFWAFRKCMARYPEKLTRAFIPRFPRNFNSLAKMLSRNGLKTVQHFEGYHSITTPGSESMLPWLLKTGILAGFDVMLPLQREKDVAAYFKQLLKENNEPLKHHYVAITAYRK